MKNWKITAANLSTEPAMNLNFRKHYFANIDKLPVYVI